MSYLVLLANFLLFLLPAALRPGEVQGASGVVPPPALQTVPALVEAPAAPAQELSRPPADATPAPGQVQDKDKAQDPPEPKPRPKVVSGLRPRSERAPMLASDGKPVAPGRIPEDAGQDARELWELILRGTRSSAAEAAPVESFRMSFDVTHRHEGGVNDVTLDLAYSMQEGYLRTDVPRSRRTQLRGPDGDFLIEGSEVVELIGRENAQSRRDMDQWIAIARNFLALTNPGSVRIVSMREVAAPSDRLPEEAARAAAGLRWLAVESPDFHLYSTSQNGAGIFEARLGVRPHTAEVEYSLIQERGRAGFGEARLFAHRKFSELEGYKLPHNVLVYMIDFEDPGLGFYARPSIDLWLRKGGQLNPELPEGLFRPLPAGR